MITTIISISSYLCFYMNLIFWNAENLLSNYPNGKFFKPLLTKLEWSNAPSALIFAHFVPVLCAKDHWSDDMLKVYILKSTKHSRMKMQVGYTKKQSLNNFDKKKHSTKVHCNNTPQFWIKILYNLFFKCRFSNL